MENQKLKIKIKRIDKSLPLPIYQTNGSVGFDLLTRKTTTIQPREIKLIPGNIILKVPKGYMLMIAPRSSTPKKCGVLMPHSVGILDQDYCGEEDEILIQIYNFKDTPIIIQSGERIAQGILVRVDRFEFEEIDKMSKKSRGGYGSTG